MPLQQRNVRFRMGRASGTRPSKNLFLLMCKTRRQAFLCHHVYSFQAKWSYTKEKKTQTSKYSFSSPLHRAQVRCNMAILSTILYCLHVKSIGYFTYLLSYPMVQDIIWKAESNSTCQKISPFWWNPEVHYRAHKSPPLDPILSQFAPSIPVSLGSILKLSSHLHLGLPSGLLPSGLPTKTL
jgi:hypothetical protein